MTHVLCLPASDDEDWSNGYPIGFKYRDLFDDILTKWRVTPLPAFDTSGKFIKAHDLEIALRGSLVLVYFELKHYSIRDKRMVGVSSNTVSAIATQVKILERGADRHPAPYKTQLMKGPNVLPQSPSKKEDQKNAVKAFHPSNMLPPNQPIPAGNGDSPPDAPTPSSSSKTKGKERAIEDDGDATATDDEAHHSEKGPEKGPKRRKTSHK